MTKTCLQCGRDFDKPIHESRVHWNAKRRFCSKECLNLSKVGKPSWNKGIKGVMKRNSGSFKKGNKPSLKLIQLLKERRGSLSPSWTGGKTSLTCKICGIDFKVDAYRKNTAKTCSKICYNEYRKRPEFRLSLSEIQKRIADKKFGEFRSYLTSLDKLIRHSIRYKIWRSGVFNRDNYTCRMCGKRGNVLRADHIKQFGIILLQNDIKTFEQAMLCSELWDINNGRTLCNDCHLLTPTYGQRVLII